MKKYILISCVFAMVAAAALVSAKPAGDGGNKSGWKQPARMPVRSLYLDLDPARVLAMGHAAKQLELTEEQLRELRSLGTKYQNNFQREHSVAQEAREELEQAMSQEPVDENAVRKISERAILADANLERVRLQFWLDARQRLGKEVIAKIRQALLKPLRGGEAEENKRASDAIVPPQKPQLPAKD